MAGDPKIQALYARFPAFKASRVRRLFACIALAAISYSALYLVATGLTVLGVAFLTNHPTILYLVALVPGIAILRDQKAGAADFIGYLGLSWLAMLLIGAVFVIALWALV